jgi:hypothetical protein
MPWPASGPDREGYKVTTTDLSWIGVSTQYGSMYQSTGSTSPAPGCVAGPPGTDGFINNAFEVVEVPDALILDDFRGPLYIKAIPAAP